MADEAKRTKPPPIRDRIRAAMKDRSSADYYEIITATFPDDQFPRAFRYTVNGGPPGCAMAFGRALRQMGWCERRSREGRRIYNGDKHGSG